MLYQNWNKILKRLFFELFVKESHTKATFIYRKVSGQDMSQDFDDSQAFAICALDGKYHKDTFDECFSDFALTRQRFIVELQYFVYLVKFFLRQKDPRDRPLVLRNVNQDLIREKVNKLSTGYFDLKQYHVIKEYEKVSNHDMKAVECFVKDYVKSHGLGDLVELVHFGLTSQDVNSVATACGIVEIMPYYLLSIERVLKSIEKLALNVPMLARTHGQPAVPTSLAKEMKVYLERIKSQRIQLVNMFDEKQFKVKFGGAVGNMNAHVAAFPNLPWPEFLSEFVNNMSGLDVEVYTTQIQNYDHFAELFDCMRRINVILLDFCENMWLYILLDYFVMEVVPNEVGSSTMPQKVNPIQLENARGNIELANSLLTTFSLKLPISKLQRDLSDSTMLRNLGLCFGYSIVAMRAIENGLQRLSPNFQRIRDDLDSHWEVITEGIQTILRRENYPTPYDRVKTHFRGKSNMSQKDIHAFIDDLPNLPENVKLELKQITPFNYVGYSLHI